MSDTPRNELESALKALEALVKSPERRRPDRYDARALLVPLGELVLAQGSSGSGDVESLLERARTAGAALGDAWQDAVRSELALACAEHVHAVDPRYLGLPNYDFEYTQRARARLEARLVAAGELDLEPPASLLRGVERADVRLTAFLEKPNS